MLLAGSESGNSFSTGGGDAIFSGELIVTPYIIHKSRNTGWRL